MLTINEAAERVLIGYLTKGMKEFATAECSGAK